jgi:hypothetical protein
MKRRQLLPILTGGGLCMASGPVPWSATHAVRKSFDLSYEVSAEPETVFPLLCPVREYEWLDGWDCEMVYSQSGVAELGCVFKTRFGEVPEMWHVNFYDPPRRIEYLVVAPDTLITRLTIELARSGEARTQLRWRRLFTSLSPAGQARADSWTSERERELGLRLEHFLKTGEMLKRGRV